MCRKIRNDNLYFDPETGEKILDVNNEIISDYYNRPFKGIWAIDHHEYVIDSCGKYIGYMNRNIFVGV